MSGRLSLLMLIVMVAGSAFTQTWSDDIRDKSVGGGPVYGYSFFPKWYGYELNGSLGRHRIRVLGIKDNGGGKGLILEYNRKLLNSTGAFTPYFVASTGYYSQPDNPSPYGSYTRYLHAGLGWDLTVYKWLHLFHSISIGLDQTFVHHPAGFRWIPITDGLVTQGIMLKIPISGGLRHRPDSLPEWDALPGKLGLFVDTQYEMDPFRFSSMDYWHFRAGIRFSPRWYGFAQATVVTNTMRGVIAAGVKPGDPDWGGAYLGVGAQIARKKRWSVQMEGTAGFLRRPFIQGAAFTAQASVSAKLRRELIGNTYLDMGIIKYAGYDFWLGEIGIPNGYSFGIGKRF